jgi:hypothetical protein
MECSSVSEWQPIETAPQGPERVIVIGGRYKEPEVVVADGDWWRATHSYLSAIPTHWMPLPPPTPGDAA